MSWIPLNVHSQFSILHSTASVKDLANKAQEYHIPALALTDFCNMFGAVDFYKAAISAQLKPIIGLEMMIAPTSRSEKKKTANGVYGHPITLLAKDTKGYQNLCKISSIGYLEGFYYTPRIDKEILSKHATGLICLSGSTPSLLAELAVKGNEKELLQEMDWFFTLFQDDFYFEIQNHQMMEEKIIQHGMNKESWLLQKYNQFTQKQAVIRQTFKDYSAKLGIECVATNDIKYIHEEDYKAQEILMNIQAGEVCELWERDHLGNPKSKILNPKREVLCSHEFYFKSPAQMMELFADFPQAVTNSKKIADKISFSFDFNKKFYPIFVPPSLQERSFDDQTRVDAAATYLRRLCTEAIPTRYTPDKLEKIKEKNPKEDPVDVVKNRLSYELDVIISKGLCDYLLIVYDFIFWAKSNKIPVGPGRGSGVGSIILYLIGVTDIEPLRFSLFFERFINPERLSYPDIDVDICMDRRQEVIDYTIRKYGKDRVAQIITFGTMKAKMAIKDVGRVLNVPLAKVNDIAKVVPEDLNITIEKALEIDPDFKRIYDTDEEAKRLIDFAKKVEGSIRNTGIHAAGLIICGDSLTDHIPVCNAKDTDILVTQFSMKPVEMVGMLKIDFLGLKTLTCIQRAVDTIQKHTKVEIDWVSLPLDDSKTFDLLNQGKTLGIFQLESGGMRDLARQLHIDKFEEIIAVGALYRPGPMEMIPSFINRKHGKEDIEIDHPLMADILKETYGIIVYQEQVMQIAQTLANYSLGEGDVLRRAMGKKDKEEMSRQGEKFKQGALANHLSQETAMMIFDKVEKFASYGFNKSHATAYAYLTYVTSFLKANYTKEWMSALMTCDLDDLTKVAKHIQESQSLNIDILPPDVNESFSEFFPTNKGIRFSLGAIKGIGEGVVETIVKEREKNGFFTSLTQFIQCIDSKKVGKKATESLIDAGCFDFTGQSRAYMKKMLDEMHDLVVKQQKEKQHGIMDLFSKDHTLAFDEKEIKITVEDNKLERLKKEKELLGFYLTGHPLSEYDEIIKKLGCIPLNEIRELPHNSVLQAAFVLDTVQTKISKNQKKFAIIVISDGVERFELPVWADIYLEKAFLLEENRLLYGIFVVDQSEEAPKLSVRLIDDLTTMNDEKMMEYQTTYESLKKQTQHIQKKKKIEEVQQIVNTPKEVQIVVDIEKLQMTSILQLKKLFEDYAGSYPVQIHFYQEQRSVQTLWINHNYGISYTAEFEKAVRQFSFCLDVRLTK